MVHICKHACAFTLTHWSHFYLALPYSLSFIKVDMNWLLLIYEVLKGNVLLYLFPGQTPAVFLLHLPALFHNIHSNSNIHGPD